MAEYIEREAAIAAAFSATSLGNSAFRDVYDTVNRLRLIPTADVQPVRHGRWNEESPDCLDGDSVYVCSVCGETWTLIEGTPLDNNMHYCPNCGAKMDSEVDNGNAES
jgi:rubrerythrin